LGNCASRRTATRKRSWTNSINPWRRPGYGEGQDAAELRQRIEEMITTNAQFNSVMVHEIRVPMTGIRGYADMLSKNVVGTLNEMQTQFVETIRST
jgi:signal transduction histidine kinase